MIDTSVLSPGNLALSVISGAFAGLYLTYFHPTASRRTAVMRAVELALVGTILYAARIAFALAGHQPDMGRVASGWFLWLLFAAVVGVVKLALVRRVQP